MGRTVEGLLRFAARRWPGGGGAELEREWRAEMAVLPRRERLGFAGSLAVASVGGFDVLGAVAGVGAVALLAGAAFNGVHRVGRLVGGFAATGLALVVAAAGMAWLGRRWAGRSPAWTAVGLGVAAGAFLLAGNRVAVMPYMGWRDIGPAVAAWTLVVAGAVAGVTRLLAAGRRRVAVGVAWLGAVAALDAAAGLGSVHAAAGLKVPPSSAPLWLPLALLPGGTVRFGPFHADGTGRFGGRLVTGPAFHASEVLLGNASAMVGPLLLCTAFVMSSVLARPDRAFRPEGPADSRRTALTAVAVVAVMLAPPAVDVRGAEAAAVAWLIAGAAAIAARRAPSGFGVTAGDTAGDTAGVTAPGVAVSGRRGMFGGRIAAMIVVGPAVGALLVPDAVRGLPVRAVIAVGAIAVTRVELSLSKIRDLGAKRDRVRLVRSWVEPVGPWMMLAGAAALVAHSVDAGARGPGALTEAVGRIEHNTVEFGFGFVGSPGGAALLVALVGVAVARGLGTPAHGG